MLHGSQKGLFDIEFCTPSQCADRLESGAADIGIAPAVELGRLGLRTIPGVCISSLGAVRSILLVSKKPLEQVRTLAADTNSRTSVALARVVLSELHGVEPQLLSRPPQLDEMLADADAAVVIGDPALRVDIDHLPYGVWDLGEVWTRWTGKPMVFAVWAARPQLPIEQLEPAFRASADYGRARIEEIVAAEAAPRGLSDRMAFDYLTQRIRFDLGQNEQEGLALFLEHAARAVSA
jgi:predicted solute-binding protein